MYSRRWCPLIGDPLRRPRAHLQTGHRQRDPNQQQRRQQKRQRQSGAAQPRKQFRHSWLTRCCRARSTEHPCSQRLSAQDFSRGQPTQGRPPGARGVAFSLLPAMLIRHTGEPQPFPERRERFILRPLIIGGWAHSRSLSYFTVSGGYSNECLAHLSCVTGRISRKVPGGRGFCPTVKDAQSRTMQVIQYELMNERRISLCATW